MGIVKIFVLTLYDLKAAGLNGNATKTHFFTICSCNIYTPYFMVTFYIKQTNIFHLNYNSFTQPALVASSTAQV
jgi:hypothetical protein